MEIWILTFFISSGNLAGRHFNGGLYQAEELCQLGAMHQLPHWRRVHGARLEWRCQREMPDAVTKTVG